jgi:hypothetical protein
MFEHYNIVYDLYFQEWKRGEFMVVDLKYFLFRNLLK